MEKQPTVKEKFEFVNWEYEAKDDELPLHYHAYYREDEEPRYKGNPFIECLPPLLNEDEACQLLARYPMYSDDDKNLPTLQRIMKVQSLIEYFEPYERTFVLKQNLDIVIREGYLQRYTTKKREVLELKTIYDRMKSHGENILPNASLDSIARGFSVIGTTGMGKSLSINRILNLFPRVIYHTDYKGDKTMRAQVVYVKLDCSHAGSVKGLAIDFFKDLDNQLGTNYLKEYGNPKNNIDMLVSHVAKLVNIHKVGLLIIDEIQHILASRNADDQKMLNFLVKLNNVCNVPIIFIGTTEAEKLLSKAGRATRRSEGVGNLHWGLHLYTDEDWRFIMEGMWEFQWTRNYTPLTEEVLKALYECTKGILAVAINLYIIVQTEAMKRSEKGEIITPELIRYTYAKYMPAMKRITDSININNPSSMRKLEDIASDSWIKTLNDTLSDMYESIDISKLTEEQNTTKNSSSQTQIINKLVSDITKMNIPFEIAYDAAEKSIADFGRKTAYSKLLLAATEYAIKSHNLKTERFDLKDDSDDKGTDTPRTGKESPNKYKKSLSPQKARTEESELLSLFEESLSNNEPFVDRLAENDTIFNPLQHFKGKD